jgi:hypothetical protein
MTCEDLDALNERVRDVLLLFYDDLTLQLGYPMTCADAELFLASGERHLMTFVLEVIAETQTIQRHRDSRA